MNAKTLSIFFLLLTPLVYAWQIDRRSGLQHNGHNYAKRRMYPRDTEKKRRTTTPKTREQRLKPSGYLAPLEPDEIGNDEVVSVGIGPPAMRPKYDKTNRIPRPVNTTDNQSNFIKDVLVQIGRELLNHRVNEDFIFGEYIGNCLKNITGNLKTKLQHEILELILKYRTMSNIPKEPALTTQPIQTEVRVNEETRVVKNDTQSDGHVWPDFSNLATYLK